MPNHLVYRLKSYLIHSLTAKSRFNVHSPFLNRFIEQVVKNPGDDDSAYKEVENLRKQLTADKTWFRKIELGDLQKEKSRLTQVGYEFDQIAIPEKYGEFIYRLVRFQKARYALELGMGFGIGTAYLLKGLSSFPDSRLFTMEGCPETLKIARNYLDKLNYQTEVPNYKIQEGNFDDRLNEAFFYLPEIDIVLLDGNHQKEALIRYINQIMPFMNEKGVFIIDDIYWSPEMHEAWTAIINDSRITLSLDFYRMGIVFLNPALSNENFKLRL